MARRAKLCWLKSPCVQNKIELNRLEAVKKKLIAQAKKASLNCFVDSLESNKSNCIGRFTKKMSGSASTSSTGYPIRFPDGTPVRSTQDKANLFCHTLSNHTSLTPPVAGIHDKEAVFNDKVLESISSQVPNPLNSVKTIGELATGLLNIKSKAMGSDLISNTLLKNLSPTNLRHLLHFFNLSLTSGFVPGHWKSAVVIPLLKPEKIPDDVNSYRPISITSCLSKVFERIIKNRIQGHLDTHNLIPNFQAGFRPGFSTIDHIVRLESHIKEGFNTNKSTFAVFLDIAKAYDSVWIPALLYKLSKLNISGSILNWLKNCLSTAHSPSVLTTNFLPRPCLNVASLRVPFSVPLYGLFLCTISLSLFRRVPHPFLRMI